jgi:transcription initiation factor TFIIIB Brf1 subunit/transcription initiation factor TFIIB
MIDIDNPIWAIVNSCKTFTDEPPSADTMCSHCNQSFAPSTIDGLVTCSGCNSVLGRLIDYGAEWRYYTSETANGGGVNTTRCCPPSNILLPTLGSIITNGCYNNNSGNRNTFSTQTHGKTHLLLNNKLVEGGEGGGEDQQDPPVKSGSDAYRYHMWSSMSYRERSLCSVFEHLSLIALRNGIPHIILEEAKCLYKKVSAIKITRGDNRKALVACSMYMACKFNKVPRNTKEIAELFCIPSRVITRGCKLFQQAIDIDIESSRPDDYIRRFCSRLHMDSTEREFTEHIVNRADNLDIVCDFIPTSVVSGAIYMTAVELNVSLSKKDIASVCHISEMTLMKCYRRLIAHRDALIDGLDMASIPEYEKTS